ncbi:hypothetical protein H2200_011683 [Cladophialophora chaetospira]|uniref:Zn(2)-C6 fungal-type domain-containing protein n=1 Tax=Cladophialophora chaetospira TaxID=386627 RepID=A0AA39CDC3_9EURO|nr:hypothetical protein H2200_011683 [Cladophialophora chaetospira]
MPSREFHRKNRHGCNECKRRRKKCDELRPVCGICTRLGLSCSYPPALSSTTLHTRSDNLPATQPAPSLDIVDPWHQAVLGLQSQYIEINDLQLTHHFTTTASANFTTIPGLYPLRSLNISEIAPQYPFLLHGVLATSALHLDATKLDDTDSGHALYEAKARSHLQLALSSYIRQLNMIDAGTCHFVFAFSVTLAGLSYGFLDSGLQKHDLSPEALIKSLTDIFDQLIGAVTVANAADTYTTAYFSQPFIPPFQPALRDADVEIEREVQEALSRLSVAFEEPRQIGAGESATRVPADIASTCRSAIGELYNAFRCLGRAEPDNFCGVLGWPAFVDSAYISLLKAYHPAALIVLAYYGVALHSLGYTWWLRGLGRAVVKSAATMLEASQAGEWADLLQWPLNGTAAPILTRHLSITQAPEEALKDQRPNPRFPTPFEIAFSYTYSHDFIEPPGSHARHFHTVAT